MEETIVLPADAPRRAELEGGGWTVAARSFGAHLDADRVDRIRLESLLARSAGTAMVRTLGIDDVDAVLTLDAVTVEDYPGGVATRHAPLKKCGATPSTTRRAFGAISPIGELIAVTIVDIIGELAETDFTVVHPAWRGRGLGTAVKAASVLAILPREARRMRTGGSADNAAIIAANESIGYIRDEEWVTLAPPDG